MKNYALIASVLVLIFITSCQPNSKPFDEAAAKAEITKLFDDLNSIFKPGMSIHI